MFDFNWETMTKWAIDLEERKAIQDMTAYIMVVNASCYISEEYFNMAY
jgi:hypothetical protein